MTYLEAIAEAERRWPVRNGRSATAAYPGCRLDDETVDDFRVGEVHIYDEQEGVLGWTWHGRGMSYEDAFSSVIP